MFLDSKLANGYTTSNVGKFLAHLQKHEPLNYLPFHLVKSGAIIPGNLVGKLEFLRHSTTRKARLATQMFITKIQNLDHLKVGFAPVTVEIQGIAYKSEFSDLYRSFALFDKYMQMDWDSLCNGEPVAKMFIDRLLRLGNSKEAEVNPFFTRKSPLGGGYEVMTFIKKLRRFPRNPANQGAE